MGNVRQEMPLLYALKAVCAAGVVYLHTWYKNEYIFLFAKLAVPIFFMISGYFLYNATSILDNKKVMSSIKKTIGLIIWANLIYILYYLLMWGVTGIETLHITTFRYFLTWFISGANLCFPLWYLHAYIQALLCILLLVKIFNSEKLLVWIAALLSIGGILIGKYAFLWNINNIEITGWAYRNFLFYGIPCIIWGMIIKKHETHITNKRSLLVWATTLLLFVIEIKGYQHIASFGGNGDLAIMSIPLAMSTILVCIKYKDTFSMKNPLVIIGKHYAMQIYVLHILFYMICLYYWEKPYQHSEIIYTICVAAPIVSTWLFHHLKKGIINK